MTVNIPAKNGGIVLITRNDLRSIIFEGVNDSVVGVELIVSLVTAELSYIDIHATLIYSQ